MDIPISVQKRPFCIEPITSVMLPDGIFDATIRVLDIAFHVTNHSEYDLTFCWVRPHRTSSSEWQYVGNTFTELGPMKSGTSRLVRWKAVFTGCTPGKKALNIEFGAQIDWARLGGGFDGFIRRNIFVCRTTKDEASGLYICEVPEGHMRLKLKRRSYTGSWKVIDYSNDGQAKEIKVPPFGIVEAFTGSIVSKPGAEDLIPFQDPWWKVVAWIIAAIAAIAAVIAAKEGKGTASIGVSGDFSDGDDPQANWCIPDPAEHPDWINLAGVLSIISTAAIRIGMMDEMDPIQKGRNIYPSFPGDPRMIENLEASITTPKRLAAGEEWRVPIEWTYSATKLSGQVSVERRHEVGFSEVVARNVRIDVPAEVRLYLPIVANVYLEDRKGIPLAGDAIFGHVNFISPGGRIYKVALENRDFTSRKALAPGNFQAGVHTEAVAGQIGADATRGKWRVEFYAQLVNDATEDLSPFEAAKRVGGDFLLAPISLERTDGNDQHEQPKCQPDKTINTLVK